MENKFQKGFAWIPILIIFAVACIVGAGNYYYVNKVYLPGISKKASEETQKMQEVTQKAKKKKFEEETKDWLLFKEERYGFQFKYPQEWTKKTDYDDSEIKCLDVYFNFNKPPYKPKLRFGFNLTPALLSPPIYEKYQKISEKTITVAEVSATQQTWQKPKPEQAEALQVLVVDFKKDNNNLHFEFLIYPNENKEEHIQLFELLLSTFQFIEKKVGFAGELILSQLYPNPKKPEMIKIKFNRDVDEATLNSSTVKLFAVSVSVGSAGQREDLSDELNYSYQKEEKILIITSKGAVIGGCAACRFELQLTDGIKDPEGDSLKPAVLSL